MHAVRFEADLWAYDEPGGWVFAGLPQTTSEDIRSVPRPPGSGFGSIRVRATLGDSTWSTSIFYDTKRAQYLLPVKRSIRDAEGVSPGDRVVLEVETTE